MGGAEGMNVKAGSRTAWRVEGRSGGRGVISQHSSWPVMDQVLLL